MMTSTVHHARTVAKTLVLALLLLAAPAGMARADDVNPDEVVTDSAPAEDADALARAYTTLAPAIAPGVNEKRIAALAYMDGALALMDMARAHLRDAESDPRFLGMAHAELEAASGKATTALLEMFHDPAEASRFRPLASALGRAEAVALSKPAVALAIIEKTRPAMASIYQTELATMGGGAGGAPPDH